MGTNPIHVTNPIVTGLLLYDAIISKEATAFSWFSRQAKLAWCRGGIATSCKCFNGMMQIMENGLRKP